MFGGSPMRFSLARKGRRAASLAEALVACFMVLLLLSLVSLAVRGYRQVLNQVHGHDETMDAALALQSVAREASGSVAITSTSPLTFRRVDPSDPNRLPAQLAPVPFPIPASWDPLNPAWLEEVTYSLIGGDLTRQVRFPDPTTSSRAAVARGLDGFSASLSVSGLLELTARLPGPRLVKAAVKIQ